MGPDVLRCFALQRINIDVALSIFFIITTYFHFRRTVSDPGGRLVFACSRTIAPVPRPFFFFWSRWVHERVARGVDDLRVVEWVCFSQTRPGKEWEGNASRLCVCTIDPFFSLFFPCPFLSVTLGSVLCSIFS